MAEDYQIGTAKWDKGEMDWLRFGQGKEVLAVIPGVSVQSVLGSAAAVVGAFQELTEDFTVYLFDRKKDFPPVYPVHAMAEDTAEAIRALGLEKVYLYGVSQGGMICMDLAVHHPELAKALFLGATAAHVADEQLPLFDRWIQLAKAGKAEELYLAFGEDVYPKAVFEGARELLCGMAKSVTPEELRRFAIQVEAVKDFDIRGELDKIACPVLLIASSDDRVLGAQAGSSIADLLKGRPDFAFHLYDGYGHAVYDTAPDYRQRVLDFYRETKRA